MTGHFTFDVEDVGVPDGEGESWAEAAERLRDGQERVTVDRHVIDSTDLANIGLVDLADAVIDAAGEPDQAGSFETPVRVRGDLVVDVDGGESA